jgi:hypothetical protein
LRLKGIGVLCSRIERGASPLSLRTPAFGWEEVNIIEILLSVKTYGVGQIYQPNADKTNVLNVKTYPRMVETVASA